MVIRGRVQGVFFRSETKSVAERGGVTGWVRNVDDGSVEALLQGDPASVERVVQWCKRGPDRARVDSVERTEIPCNETYRNFSILY